MYPFHIPTEEHYIPLMDNITEEHQASHDTDIRCVCSDFPALSFTSTCEIFIGLELKQDYVLNK